MCARYAFFNVSLFEQEFEVDPGGIEAQYNNAPTDVVPGIINVGNGRELVFFQWGLVPSWAKDPSIGQKLINARGETLSEKPSFRSAFKRRRCLLPADGFFEWNGEKGRKQPYYIHLDRPFALAGLWEDWESPDGALVTCTIVTTVPNDKMQEIHTRMPVIIDRADYDAWLDPHQQDTRALTALLAPYPSARMSMYTVSRAMSNPRFKSPSAISPIAPETLF